VLQININSSFSNWILPHEWEKFLVLRGKIRDCDGVILKAFNKYGLTFYTRTAKYTLKKPEQHSNEFLHRNY
jgi:hypothetical protein